MLDVIVAMLILVILLVLVLMLVHSRYPSIEEQRRHEYEDELRCAEKREARIAKELEQKNRELEQKSRELKAWEP